MPKGIRKNSEPGPEVYQPMAVEPPTMEEQVKALELRITELEKMVTGHHRYHFGKP
jgi:hypothetical protein